MSFEILVYIEVAGCTLVPIRVDIIKNSSNLLKQTQLTLNPQGWVIAKKYESKWNMFMIFFIILLKKK